MFRTTLVVLAAMACAQARPQHPHFTLPTIQFPSPQASGNSNSGITLGQTITPGGLSEIRQQQALTGGAASQGGINTGSASANSQSATGLLGNINNQQTSAESNQFTNPFGTFPVIQGFPNLGGQAMGQAGAQLTQGTTTTGQGTTTITQLGSSASGSAAGGASSINKATGSTTSIDTPHGSQSSSSVDSQSTQISGR